LKKKKSEEERKMKELSKQSSNLMKMGLILIGIAVCIYVLISLPNLLSISISDKPTLDRNTINDFEITSAFYYTKFSETVINLTYYGNEAVNVSVYKEEWLDQAINRTEHIGIMQKGDTVTIGFHGYATWIEVIYEDKRIRLDWIPEGK